MFCFPSDFCFLFVLSGFNPIWNADALWRETFTIEKQKTNMGSFLWIAKIRSMLFCDLLLVEDYFWERKRDANKFWWYPLWNCKWVKTQFVLQSLTLKYKNNSECFLYLWNHQPKGWDRYTWICILWVSSAKRMRSLYMDMQFVKQILNKLYKASICVCVCALSTMY